MIDHLDVVELTALIAARLDNDDHHLARVGMRHHYFDTLQVGDSTARFFDAVSELVTLRDRLVGAAHRSADVGGAITA